MAVSDGRHREAVLSGSPSGRPPLRRRARRCPSRPRSAGPPRGAARPPAPAGLASRPRGPRSSSRVRPDRWARRPRGSRTPRCAAAPRPAAAPRGHRTASQGRPGRGSRLASAPSSAGPGSAPVSTPAASSASPTSAQGPRAPPQRISPASARPRSRAGRARARSRPPPAPASRCSSRGGPTRRSPVGRLVLGGADRRLDAVDVEEPVGAPPVLAAAREAVDRLHEAAAVARLELALRSSTRSTVSDSASSTSGSSTEHVGAVVAGHGQLGRPRPRRAPTRSPQPPRRQRGRRRRGAGAAPQLRLPFSQRSSRCRSRLATTLSLRLAAVDAIGAASAPAVRRPCRRGRGSCPRPGCP